MRNNHIKNFSNYFGEVFEAELGYKLKHVLEKADDYVSGVEVTMSRDEGVASLMLVTPPHLRVDGAESCRELVLSDFTMYEGYLLNPFFLPLYDDLNGEFLKDVQALADSLNEDESVWMQWLFRRAYNWKETALQMFMSYLEGNDYPLTSRLGRALQDKTLQAMNRISSFDDYRDYIEEAEQKILGEGYQFQLRVAIRSQKTGNVLEAIEDLFKRYDAHNGIRLCKVREKKMKQFIEDCVLTADTKYQILSKREVLSLFGANTEQPIETEVGEIIANPVSAKVLTASDIIQLLPSYPREEVLVKEGLEQDIAEALKRVGLIKQARLYNEYVTAGIRLTVVQFDIPKGKNLTHITQKSKDIQAALGVPSLGIEQGDEPDTVRFTLPNEKPAIISLRELLEDRAFQKFSKENPLAFIVGVDEVNNPIYLSLAKLVHLLVAGTTGSGKSVFINSLATTLMLTHTPQELKMVMIDPKQVELQQYVDFPHVEDVVTDVEEAAETLKELTEIMDVRYTVFKDAGVKNITLYNKKSAKPMPYIVCIVDEYADLMDTNPEVEDHIVRLGQKARAAGIHLVIATQRPSANVVSGRIKANITNAISFNLGNNINYKTVFGQGIGDTTLLGRGDGIMKIESYPKEFQRFQSTIISPDESEEEEIYKQLAEYLQATAPRPEPELEPEPEQEEEEEEEEVQEEEPIEEPEGNHLYKLKQIIADTRETKISVLREKLKIKAATMTELMGKLVDEGWLKKHESKAKGYELIASDTVLSEWKTN